MNKNKIIFYGTVLLIILLIAVPSIMKTVHKHNERLIAVTEKKIIETAKNCYYTESCINKEITLNELYEKTDLEVMINPLTKKAYNESSYVDTQDNFKFIEKE